jgi:hypothetical protein
LGFSRNEHYAEKPFFVTTIVDFAKNTKINESLQKVFGQKFAETFGEQQMPIFRKVLTKKQKRLQYVKQL